MKRWESFDARMGLLAFNLDGYIFFETSYLCGLKPLLSIS